MHSGIKMSDLAYNRIKVVLAERGMDALQLAKELDVTPQTMSRWLSNRAQPSIERFHEIARILEVDFFTLCVNPPVPRKK